MTRSNRDYYDAFSSVYENGRERAYHRLIDELELTALAPYARGKRVLEAGCGTGLILARLAEIAKEAVGVDQSPGMLATARARGLDVYEADLVALPFDDASFDTVCSFKVLAHVENIRAALAELARVTKPGGHLVLEFYNPQSLRGLIKRVKPATAIPAEPLNTDLERNCSATQALDDHQVYTRFDRLADIRAVLPPGLTWVETAGVRVVTPMAGMLEWPLVGRILAAAERAVLRSRLARLAGFVIVVLRKE